jgi:hypothetical protein
MTRLHAEDHEVRVPVNGVSHETQVAILELVFTEVCPAAASALNTIEWVWKTTRGTLPKRVRAALVKASVANWRLGYRWGGEV